MTPALALVWTTLCFGIYLAAWLPGFRFAWVGWFWSSPLPAPDAFAAALSSYAGAGLWVVAVNAAALSTGGLLDRWLWSVPQQRGMVLRLVLGLAVILPLAGLGLGLAGLLRPYLLVTGVLVAALLGLRCFRPGRMPTVPPLTTACVLAGMLLLPSLVRALAPQIEYDALRYHFALPHGYLVHGRVFPGEPRPLCHLPLGAEMLLALGMAGGGDTAAQLLNWQWLPLLLWLAHRCASVLGFTGSLALVGWVALAASPLMTSIGGGGFTDLFACVAVAAALLLALERRRGHAVVCGLLVGAAGGAKLSMVPLGVAWLVPLVSRRIAVRTAAAWMVPVVPWFVKNWLFTDSPFGGIALTRYWPAFDHANTVTQLYLAARWTSVDDPAVWLSLPRFLLHNGVIAGHEVSPLVAIALPALFLGWSARHAATRPLRIAAVAGLIAWAIVGGGQVRYLAPLLLPITMATSAVWFTPSRALIFGAACLGWIRITAACATGAAPLPVVLGAQPRVEYLGKFLTPRGLYMAMGGWLADHPETGRPYVAGDIKAYYWPRDPLVDTEYNLPGLFQWTRDARDAGRLAVAFRQHGLGCIVHRVEGALTYQQITGGYPWTDRSLRVLQDFILHRTIEVHRIERPKENSFYRISTLTKRPAHPDPRRLHWLDLPYTELLTWPADRLLESGQLVAARAAYAELARRFPSWIIPPLRLASTARLSHDDILERKFERDAKRMISRGGALAR